MNEIDLVLVFCAFEEDHLYKNQNEFLEIS